MDLEHDHCRLVVDVHLYLSVSTNALSPSSILTDLQVSFNVVQSQEHGTSPFRANA